MPDDSIGDLPPVWVPREKSQNPMLVAKVARYGQEHPSHPGTVVFLLVGRPDDAGNEPVEVVAFDPQLAEDLAISLIRAAGDVRRAQ